MTQHGPKTEQALQTVGDLIFLLRCQRFSLNIYSSLDANFYQLYFVIYILLQVTTVTRKTITLQTYENTKYINYLKSLYNYNTSLT